MTVKAKRLGMAGKRAIGRHYIWQCPWALDPWAMEKAAQELQGCHDFTSFCHKEEKDNNNVLTIEHIGVTILKGDGWLDGIDSDSDSDLDSQHEDVADWTEPNLLAIDFEAHGFRMHLVRNLVGYLVEIGRGSRVLADLSQVFAARDRSAAGIGAPAQGLTMLWVKY